MRVIHAEPNKIVYESTIRVIVKRGSGDVQYGVGVPKVFGMAHLGKRVRVTIEVLDER